MGSVVFDVFLLLCNGDGCGFLSAEMAWSGGLFDDLLHVPTVIDTHFSAWPDMASRRRWREMEERGFCTLVLGTSKLYCSGLLLKRER